MRATGVTRRTTKRPQIRRNSRLNDAARCATSRDSLFFVACLHSIGEHPASGCRSFIRSRNVKSSKLTSESNGTDRLVRTARYTCPRIGDKYSFASAYPDMHSLIPVHPRVIYSTIACQRGVARVARRKMHEGKKHRRKHKVRYRCAAIARVQDAKLPAALNLPLCRRPGQGMAETSKRGPIVYGLGKWLINITTTR